LHRRRRTALVLTAAIAAAAPVLTACGNDAHPGAAAVVGGQRITVSQLENRVEEVRDAQRAAVSDEAQYAQAIAKTGSLTRDTLHGMVLDRVLHRAAQNAGVTVSRKEVQEMRAGLEQQAGGAEALRTAWLQQYAVAPERLDENQRLQLEAQKLAAKLGTDTSRLAGPVQGVRGTRRRPQPALRHLGHREGRPRGHQDTVGPGRDGSDRAAAGVTVRRPRTCALMM
jgi:hypothetical protein